ncbi:DUF305 domain-containing protein [Allostreptomyces psammosilenae]|uniref:Uncharacterized protein (DUF305 family) n=1 Tax=Allostreptomyces psammosilenae TaxID=1892865 RepID=A0A852ZP84_9ACTN|nr:DUF305 domain-containing protein [Allostreptomyces psammosilenae]NYI03277.1 uncharacterized protein (DUF305 family) [Allostreptomyces psammosilenae]
MTAAVGGTPTRRGVWRPAVLGGVLALLMAVGLLVVAGIGGPDVARGASTPGDSSPEAGFCRDMSIHHQQAVEMSFLVRDATDDEAVRRLAYDIINTQANQRGMMLGWLDAWDLPVGSSRPYMEWMGHAHTPTVDGPLMPGMATDAEVRALAAAEGEQAEILYLQMMLEHHRSGVTMAEAIVERTDQDDVERLAQTMVNGQTSEINLIEGMLEERGVTG